MAADKSDVKAKVPEAVKVVVRNLPLPLESNDDESGPKTDELPECFVEWKDRIESFYFLENVDCMEQSKSRRVYLAIRSADEALQLHRHYDGLFVGDRHLVVELAPYPKLPKSNRSKQDSKQSTIDDDNEYQAFVESYESESPAKPKEANAQANQEHLLKELEKRNKEKLSEEAKLTPLLQSIVDLRSKKEDLIKQREVEKKRKDAEAAVARKKRDEERRKMLDQKEKMLKEQREKDRAEKERARKEAEERRVAEREKEREKEKENAELKAQSPQKDTTNVEKMAGEAMGDEQKLVFQDAEGNGDVNTDDRKDSARSSDSSKSMTSTRATRLKDLPSIQLYRPSGAKSKNTEKETPPEERNSSFLDRENMEGTNERHSDRQPHSSGGSSSGGGGGGGRQRNSGGGRNRGGYREIKPSNRGSGGGGSSGSSSGYPSKGNDRKRDNPKKDQQQASSGGAIRYYTSQLAEAKKEKERENETQSVKKDNTKVESAAVKAPLRDDIADDSYDSHKKSGILDTPPKSGNREFKGKENSDKDLNLRTGTGRNPSSAGSRDGNRSSKAQRYPGSGRRQDDWDWGSGYDDGYGYYDRGGSGHQGGSSWNSRNRGSGNASGGPASNQSGPRNSGRNYEPHGYPRGASDYDDHYGGGNQKQPGGRGGGGNAYDRKGNRGQGFADVDSSTKSAKGDEPTKPPRFSDRRRATAASANASSNSEQSARP